MKRPLVRTRLGAAAATPAGECLPSPPASAACRDSMEQLPPPPPLSFLDRMASPGRRGSGAVVEAASPTGDLMKGGFVLPPLSPAFTGRASDPVLWRSAMSGSQGRLGLEQEPYQQGVVMDAVWSQREAVVPESVGSWAAAAAVSYSDERDAWVTVYGFGVDETNVVLREFEKCGPILNFVSGPGSVNWIHLQYQSSHDAENALRKDGMQLNSALIVGVKPLDTLQRVAVADTLPGSKLSPSLHMPLRSPVKKSPLLSTAAPAFQYGARTAHPYSSLIPKGGPPPSLASPVKSTFSKLVDLAFGL